MSGPRYSLLEPASPKANGPLGKVFLVGAGPGDPELLTVKALRILRSADIVLHDSLVGAEVLSLIPTRAERVDVGKRRGMRFLSQDEINSLLVAAAREHKTVVRLKGGDPLLFGRAAEEMRALRAANISFEVVPGISAAFGAAAAAQVSLTDRLMASHVLFTTYSRAPELRLLPLLRIGGETTVVVYMPGPDYTGVAEWLLASGILAETPCLVISKASQPEESVKGTSLSRLASLEALPAPALLVVGRVATQAGDSAAVFSWMLEGAGEAVEHKSVS
jgi:uroporphyrin-III C-methyltransferase